jgi:anaerobic selenocysteine-containing dehydrogenase
VPELQFQRPAPEVELSRDDAQPRGIATGDSVSVSHNGTSVALRARVNRGLRPGIVRIAAEHAGALGGTVEVAK